MNLSDRNIEDLLDSVRTVSRKEIMTRFRHLSPSDISTKSGPNDLVTVADRVAEDQLALATKKILTSSRFIGEEAVSENPSLLNEISYSDSVVIVDPIDGTSNFASGIALFGVILSVVEKGETVFGLLYDPVMDDWMFAKKGEGAWFSNDSNTREELSTSTASELASAIGIIPLDFSTSTERSAFVKVLDPIGRLVSFGCSCHEYRLLVSGKADFLTSVKLNPWDHAAGQLILMESGGWSEVEHKGSYSPAFRSGKMVSANSIGIGEKVKNFIF